MKNDATPDSAKILVIDDDTAITDLIKIVLEKDGFTVIEAHSGTEGIDLAAKEKPDLIIMDITMPDMDGYAATEKLKSDDNLKDIPVIFLSGRSPSEDGGRSFAKGGLTFMRKPFSNQQIRDLVILTLQAIA